MTDLVYKIRCNNCGNCYTSNSEQVIYLVIQRECDWCINSLACIQQIEVLNRKDLTCTTIKVRPVHNAGQDGEFHNSDQGPEML